uniref:PrA protein n=1 Tax=Schistosoma mansoni TaxID=6183 RepID=A0JI75_SCHMA|nr:PrA protein [Schistosoma mansoni]
MGRHDLLSFSNFAIESTTTGCLSDCQVSIFIWTCLLSSSTQLDTSPSTSENKNLIAEVYTLQLKMLASLSELNTNMKLVLSMFTDREDPRRFDCGLSSQQFPLSSEEELGTLDACLEQKDVRDRFMPMLTR